jgi:hypothetical protein
MIPRYARGKRYDLATQGRRLANATYSEADKADRSNAIIHGIDLTPLITNPDLDILLYMEEYIDRFKRMFPKESKR